jgi:hypothetical protein
MSVAYGLDPAALLELDGRMVDALERAGAARWTVLEELVAKSYELAYAHFRAFVQAHSPKGGARMPSSITVPRPGVDGFERPARISPAAFARDYGPSSSSSSRKGG